jgi:hypothetical protein
MFFQGSVTAAIPATTQGTYSMPSAAVSVNQLAHTVPRNTDTAGPRYLTCPLWIF